MSAHTPGPWVIRDGDEWTYDVVTHHGELPDGSPNAWNVASINGRRDEAKANLSLIAAAPELLAALEDLYEAYGRSVAADDWDLEAGRSAAAAIAKAVR